MGRMIPNVPLNVKVEVAGQLHHVAAQGGRPGESEDGADQDQADAGHGQAPCSRGGLRSRTSAATVAAMTKASTAMTQAGAPAKKAAAARSAEMSRAATAVTSARWLP